MFIVENLGINNGNPIPGGGEVRFDLQIPSRWVKICYVKIVASMDDAMAIQFDIWESGTYNPANRDDLYLRRFRRKIDLAAGDHAEYGEAVSPAVPYMDRDEDEEKTHALHCRLRNNALGVPSDFDVSLMLAEIGEVI